MINSPLRYPGGKSKAVKFLKSYFPKEFAEYREPFFGGGSIGLHIQQSYTDIKLVANDLNYDLYCFWICLKDNIHKLYTRVKEIKDNYSNGRSLYEHIKNSSSSSILDRGIAFFILNRITFSGLSSSGGYSDQAFLKRFTNSSIDRLLRAHKIVKDFELSFKDFEGIVEQEGNNIFMFLDPPYYLAKHSKLYGKSGHLNMSFDHNRLYKVLSITKHKFLMTYDNSEYIKHLYKDFYQLEWDLQYGLHRSKRGKELLISNYPLKSNKGSLF